MNAHIVHVGMRCRRRPETPWCQEGTELPRAWISNHVLSMSWDFPVVFSVPHLLHLFSSTWHLCQFHILFFCCQQWGEHVLLSASTRTMPTALLLDVLKVQPAAPGPPAGLPVMQAPYIWLWHRHNIRKCVRFPNTYLLKSLLFR